MPDLFPTPKAPDQSRYSISLQQAAAAIFGIDLIDGETRTTAPLPCRADQPNPRRPDEPHINRAAP